MPTPSIPAVRPPAESHDVRLAGAPRPVAPHAAFAAVAPRAADDGPRLVRAPAATTTAARRAERARVLGPAAGRPNAHRVAAAPFLRPPAGPCPRSVGDPPSPPEPEPRLLDAAALPGHVDRLYRAAVALCGNAVDAQDLVQEVCLRALAKPRVIRGADDLPYLMQMLRNVFYNQCRSQAVRRTTPVEPETLTTVSAGRRHDPELGLLVREVHQAIAALPPHYRDVVVAVDVLGLAYADAAEALGIAVGTVMSRLHRGRAGVARAVGEQAAS
jgi:RNA polymerase sigma-70 factor (ECF subfamily)